MDEGQIVENQMAYYRARAGEYDQWFLRQGRYDQGPEHRARWFQELASVETALREEVRGADVLELDCGTGLWTCRLAETNTRVVAVDASPEVLAINRERIRSANVKNVGREFDIVKVFYDPADLEHRLLQRGWNGSVRTTGTFFLYGLLTVHNG